MAGQREDRACKRCGALVEDYPYLSDTCHDCYAKDWDCGFETSSQWAEDLFGTDDDADADDA